MPSQHQLTALLLPLLPPITVSHWILTLSQAFLHLQDQQRANQHAPMILRETPLTFRFDSLSADFLLFAFAVQTQWFEDPLWFPKPCVHCLFPINLCMLFFYPVNSMLKFYFLSFTLLSFTVSGRLCLLLLQHFHSLSITLVPPQISAHWAF